MAYRFGSPTFEFRGRGGLATFSDGEHRAVLDWEMLVGPIVAVIYGDTCRWTSPIERKMTPNEVRDVVRYIANAMPATFTIQWALDGTNDEVVAPTGRKR